MTQDITPLILTYNEAPNIGRVLQKLRWARRVVVLDSFSTDETETICQTFPNVAFLQRKFDNHTVQWNFGVSQVQTGWVLALDADYILSEEFVAELGRWTPSAEVSAAFAAFRYCIGGRRLKASLYPPRAVLFRRDACAYEQDGHTQRLKINGATTRFTSTIDHDDRKSLSHWLWAQNRYAALEVEKLLAASPERLSAADKLRRMIWPGPLAVFLFTFFGKRMFIEGWPGWYYTLQRTLAELILSLRLIEAKFKANK